MLGDGYQHIEGTKGVDSWEEYKEIINFDYYEMLENYRNASQITEYPRLIPHRLLLHKSKAPSKVELLKNLRE